MVDVLFNIRHKRFDSKFDLSSTIWYSHTSNIYYGTIEIYLFAGPEISACQLGKMYLRK